MKKSKMVSNCCGAEVESVIQSGPLNSPPPAWTVCSKCKQYCGLVDDVAKEPKFTTESLDILGPLPDWDGYKQMAKAGTIRDEQNPIFIFSMTDTALLRMIVDGDIDVMSFAKRELSSRI